MLRLRIRIFLFVIALLALVLAATLWLLQRGAQQQASREIEQHLAASAQELADSLRWQGETQQGLLEAAREWSEDATLSSALREDARARLRERFGAQALVRFEASGEVRWTSQRGAVPDWQRLPAGAAVSVLLVDGERLWQVNQVALPAAEGGGRLLLARHIDEVWLQRHWGRRGGMVAIAAADGAAPALLVGLLDAAGRDAFARWNADPEHEDGWRWHVQALDGALDPLQLVLGRPLPDALIDAGLLSWQLLAVALLAVFGAAAGALWIGDSVSRPLAAMVRHMRRVSRGEDAGPLPVERRSEVGALAREFAYMLAALAQRESSIRHLAFHDALTGLLNRNRFSELVEAELQRGVDHRFGVLVLDINRFREINDTLGHVAGDRVLKEVANRLQQRCRPQDQVARLSGDQYAVLLGELPPMEVHALALRYREAFAAPLLLEGVSLDLSTSMGMAVHPEHGQRAGVLLQRAEIAMYLAKARRVGFMLYTAELDRHSLLRLTLMAELRAAIERNQLELYVQPKLDIRGWRIAGVECLVRWVHPEHGFVPPDEFIPLAEQTGAIRQLTAWMIGTALDWTQRWHEEGRRLRVAVNVSTIDLQDPGFPHRLAALIAERRLPFELLVLEVTESVVMDDPERALPVLAQLRDMGIGLSIDDFGTGYSSMAQLKRLPVEELKIDKSFVFDVTSNPDDAVIVRSIIDMAHNMELRVVAEGVESDAALDYLKRFGCDVAQGYFLSRPMPAAELSAWLEASPYLVDGDPAG
jgi:diguanylate cyclase (GGDEF)-like protein